jgi:anti-sigma regulatory factor (Ser/Thr protein kinase)
MIKMSTNRIFDIPTSPILGNLDYWITTNSESISHNYLPLKNLILIIVGGRSLAEINLETNEIALDLASFQRIAFFLSSRDRVYIEKRTMRKIFSDFDTLGIIFNCSRFKVGNLRKIIEKAHSKSVLLYELEKETKGEVILIHQKKFYSFHEVCFLRSNIYEVDNYVSYLVSKLVDFSDDDVWKIKTILYEVFDNALEHGNKFDSRKLIRSEALISNNGFHIEVSDQGEGFSFEVLSNPPNKGDPKGRGLMMIRKLSDITAIKNGGTTIEIFVSRSNTYPINLTR